MPLTRIVCCQLAQHPTYGIARSVGFDPNISLRIKMSKDRSFGKGSSELEKGSFSVGGKETRLRFGQLVNDIECCFCL